MTRGRKMKWTPIITVSLGLFLCACEDEVDRSKECGFEGNCCWEEKVGDKTVYSCNDISNDAGQSLVCKNKKCVWGTAPVPDTGPIPDTKPPADGSPADGKPDTPKGDGPGPETAPDTGAPDTGAPDTGAPDTASAG
jgi:hypothetical protein